VKILVGYQESCRILRPSLHVCIQSAASEVTATRQIAQIYKLTTNIVDENLVRYHE